MPPFVVVTLRLHDPGPVVIEAGRLHPIPLRQVIGGLDHADTRTRYQTDGLYGLV